MSESQFGFLEAEFADEFAMAEWAERHALSDPGPCSHLRAQGVGVGGPVGVPVRPVVRKHRGIINAILLWHDLVVPFAMPRVSN